MTVYGATLTFTDGTDMDFFGTSPEAVRAERQDWLVCLARGSRSAVGVSVTGPGIVPSGIFSPVEQDDLAAGVVVTRRHPIGR
jgi:hypothetical protein